MKIITLKDLEVNFDEILEDVAENRQYYRIQTEEGDFMLVPYEEYEVLKETYQDWVDDPTINPDPLPIQYIGNAEPKLEE